MIFDFDEFERVQKNLFHNGYNFVLGCDEAGRGPGAGPLYTACVCFKDTKNLKNILSDLNDSKKLSEKTRQKLYPLIIENSIYSIIEISVEKIEKLNILNASLFGMKQAATNVIKELNDENVIVLVDGNKPLKNFAYSQKAIIKGDATSASIAAASILAKVSRDNLMYKLDKKYPKYGFAQNKGYLTKEHIKAIKDFGTTEIHRKSFLTNFI